MNASALQASEETSEACNAREGVSPSRRPSAWEAGEESPILFSDNGR